MGLMELGSFRGFDRKLLISLVLGEDLCQRLLGTYLSSSFDATLESRHTYTGMAKYISHREILFSVHIRLSFLSMYYI